MGKKRLVVLCFVLLVCSACGAQPTSGPEGGNTTPEAQPTSVLERGKPIFEAREWLLNNPNPSALAANRFAGTQRALAFVELLYEKGAVAVYVTGILDEEWRIKRVGGPYADTLIVRLPGSAQQRRAIFEIENREARREGFAPQKDTGQNELVFWWD